MTNLVAKIYLLDFVEGVVEAGQQFENGNESGGGCDGKQFESVVNEAGEADEFGVVRTEADGHEQRADDVGNGRRKVRAQIDRIGFLGRQIAHKFQHFVLY